MHHLVDKSKKRKKLYLNPVVSRLLLVSLLTLSQAACAQAKEDSPPPSASATSKATAPAPAASETKLPPGSNTEVNKQLQNEKDTLIQEAITALAETESALALLEQGKKKEALEAMARATGKLEILMAREPELALAPVDVAIKAQDFLGTPKEIEQIVKKAKSALGDNDLQFARMLLDPLSSEITIETTNLPMATYPAVIKSAAGLIDKDKVDAAKHLLTTTLNTLVIERIAIPIPLLNAEEALRNAETLTEKNNRSADEEKQLAELLRLAQDEVARAEALGYGSKAEHKAFLKEIKALQKKTEGGKSGQNWFENVGSALKNLFESSKDNSKSHR